MRTNRERENLREKALHTISKEPNEREKGESGKENLLWLSAKCLWVWVEKFTKIWFLSLPSALTGSLQWEPYAFVQPRPTSPNHPPPSALAGPGMCELCTLARMHYLHPVPSQQEQTHSSEKFTACINSHIANYLCPFILMDKYGITAGLQTAICSPEAYEKNELPSKVTTVRMTITHHLKRSQWGKMLAVKVHIYSYVFYSTIHMH